MGTQNTTSRSTWSSGHIKHYN